ncbi:hypothetical protein JCM3775_001152 [Rhodotorula graminis]
MGRVTTLEILSGDAHVVAHALSHVNKHLLGRLVLVPTASLVPVPGEPVIDFNDFEALVEVELGVASSQDWLRLQDILRFPHLRSLSIKCEDYPHREAYEDVVVWAHHVAPSLVVLKLHNCDPAADYFPADCPSPLLPYLRVLRLDTDQMPELDWLSLDRLPALERFDANVLGRPYPHPLSGAAPSKRTTLRSVHVTYNDTSPIPLEPAERAEWDKLGIRIFERWTPSYDAAPETSGLPKYEHGSLEGAEEAVEAVARLFSWATERARWLAHVGDSGGLDELSEAAYRLRERFVVEHM